MNDILLQVIQQLFQATQRILVVSHIRPDGDAVGSVLGLGLALRELGKEVQMVLEDQVPFEFRHLTGADLVQKKVRAPYDIVVVLDCSDVIRVGYRVLRSNPDGGKPPRKPDVNIDHHVTNENFAVHNLVDEKAAATAEVLVRYMPAWDLPITQSVAEALLTGIISDTLGFRTSNMHPQVMNIAAVLMEKGANLPELYQKTLNQRTFQAARYWGPGLSRLERDGALVWTSLTLADRRTVDYPGRDDADLINVLATINDASVSLIFVEQNNGTVKVSWRSQPGYDVAKIAVTFGGGGHQSASGAEIAGTLAEVQEKVLQATRGILR